MSRKLNQVLAVEKGVKQRTYATTTELHKVGQQPALFNGFSKSYRPLEDGGIAQPPQSQKVAFNADDIFGTVQKGLAELFDVTATKDWGNQSAKADIVVDGQTILTGVPATYLLFLDKQLSDLRDLIGKMAELDPAVDWSRDPSSGLYRSAEVKSHTTAKVQKPIVLYDATDKHPAQTQLITQDVIVGEWTTVKQSGALPATRKKLLLERVQKLLDAVKVSLEEANMTKVEDQKTGNAVLGYIFA